MSLLTNNFDGGTNGMAITPANSGAGSGQAFSNSAYGNGTIVYDNTIKILGSLAGKFNSPSAATTFLALTDSIPANSFSSRLYVYLSAFPSDTISLCEIQNQAGVITAGVYIGADGTLAPVVPGSMLGALSIKATLNTWYRISMYGTVGAAGSLTVSLYAGHNETALATYANLAVNTGTSPADKLLFGKIMSAPSIGDMWFDEIALNIGTSTEIGAAQAAGMVTANAGPDYMCEPGSTAWLVTRGYDNLTSKYMKAGTWAQVGGPAVALTPVTTSDGVDLASFVAPKTNATQTYVFRLTVTGSDSSTATDDTAVTVPAWQSWDSNGLPSA